MQDRETLLYRTIMRRTWAWPHELRFEGSTVHYGFGGMRPAIVAASVLGIILATVACGVILLVVHMLQSPPTPTARERLEGIALGAGAVAWCVGMFALVVWMIAPRRIRSEAIDAGLMVERSFWGMKRTSILSPPYRVVAQQYRNRGSRWIQIRVADCEGRKQNLAKLMVDADRLTSGRRVIRSTVQLLLADPLVEWRLRSKPLGKQDVATGEFRFAWEEKETE